MSIGFKIVLSIRNKLLLVSFLLASAGFFSWLTSTQFIRINKANLTEIRNAKLQNLLMAQAAKSEFENYISSAVVAVSTKEIQVLEDDKLRIDKIDKILIQLVRTDSSYITLTNFAPKLNEVHKISMEYLHTLSGKIHLDENMTKALRENNQKIRDIKIALDKIQQKADREFTQTVEKMNNDSNQFAITGSTILALIIGFVILSSMILLRSIITRINRLKNHFSNTGIDSLEPISDTGEDELGDLLKVSNKMLMNIKESRSQLVEKDFVENIVNTISDMIVVCDHEWKIIRANLAAKKFFSNYEESIYGENIFNLLCQNNGNNNALMKQNLSESGILNTNALFSANQKKDIPVYISAARMTKTAKNMHSSYVFIIRDMTSQVANEKEKMVLEAQLAQSAKLASLGTLGAGVAHELNNPLSAVIGYAELIQRSKDTPPKTRDFAKTILRCSERMKRIIDELRKFTRDTSLLEFEAIDVHAPIQGVLIFLQHRINLMNVEIKMDLCKEAKVILGDHNQLESVFLNLLTNSCDSFADVHDSRKKEIHIKTIYEDNSIFILFKDNAMGIPENILKNIFDPFFTTKPVGSGTGLGLFIVHQIVKNHKGSIEASSTEGHGTQFKLRFPTVDQSLQKPSSIDNPASYELSSKKASVLVIDDEIFILNLFDEMLSEIFNVQIENDPIHASEILKEKTFDLILCDAKMPKLTGIEVLKSARKTMGIQTPFVIMSGHAKSQEDVQELLNQGANFVLAKPLPPRDELIHILQDVIQKVKDPVS